MTFAVFTLSLLTSGTCILYKKLSYHRRTTRMTRCTINSGVNSLYVSTNRAARLLKYSSTSRVVNYSSTRNLNAAIWRNGESMSMAWPTLRSRTAKEQNRSRIDDCIFKQAVACVDIERSGLYSAMTHGL